MIELTAEQYDDLNFKTRRKGSCRFAWNTGEPATQYDCLLHHGHTAQHHGHDSYGNLQTFGTVTPYRVINHG